MHEVSGAMGAQYLTLVSVVERGNEKVHQLHLPILRQRKRGEEGIFMIWCWYGPYIPAPAISGVMSIALPVQLSNVKQIRDKVIKI